MSEDKKGQSNAAIDHESATMQQETDMSASEPKPSPQLPINIGSGWRKGAGTDMI